MTDPRALPQALDTLRETLGIISRLVALADDAAEDEDDNRLYLRSDSELVANARTVLLHVQLVLSINNRAQCGTEARMT